VPYRHYEGKTFAIITDMHDKISEVLDQLLFFYEGYSKEYRASTQPFRLQAVQKLVKNYHYNCKDDAVREPLIEHSGSLAIVATTIYPHIANQNVDLGKALTMLAIHDIGELLTGEQGQNEQQQALKLLPEYYHELYWEVEERTSDTARFAKAIDKITPDIVDLLTPAETNIERYKVFTGKNPEEIVPMIKDFKHPYMTWNPFLTKLHLKLLDRLDKKLKPYYSK
jgi:5'-deoxynucleotidase YfbR-like HD superfamily hydrolase